jgi:hypothetical protein
LGDDHESVIPEVPAKVAIPHPARLKGRQIFEEKRAQRSSYGGFRID